MLSRRGFLLGSGAAALLAACGDEDSPTITPDATTTTTGGTGGDPGGIVLGEAFDRNGMLVAAIAQRAPFLLFEASGGLVPVEAAPAEIAFTAAVAGGETLAPVTVARGGDGIERPYYPLTVTFPSAGQWSVFADLGDGQILESVVQVNDDVAVAQVGEPLPVAATPTTADPGGVTTLCTNDPPCPFHEISLDTARAEGRPVVVLVSTPAYCQVGICGPVLDLLIAEAPNHPDLTVVHIEVYPNGAPPEPPTPIVTDTLGLQYEPALFVADTAGTVTSRLDNIFDGPELAAALGTVG
jgi:hypothetical protein